MGICESPNKNKEKPKEKDKPEVKEIKISSDIPLNGGSKPVDNNRMGIYQGPDINNQISFNGGLLNVNSTKEFLQKAEKAIFEIIVSNESFGSGFFCKIPYTENNNLLLPVLITCNHVLNEDSINSKDITIILNGESKTIPLKQRKKWTNENLDFTCIEIKEKEDNINDFFYLDDSVLMFNCSNNNYLNKKVRIYGIYGISKEDCKQLAFSDGLIKICGPNVCDEGEQLESQFFAYDCNTYPGFSGGCIVNQANNCVIGIHKGALEKTKLNAGIFIREIIKYIKDKEKIKIQASK